MRANANLYITVAIATCSHVACAKQDQPGPSHRCPEGMVWVEGGQFFMGSQLGSTLEQPVHKLRDPLVCFLHGNPWVA